MGFLRRLRGPSDDAAPGDGSPRVNPFLDDAMGDDAAREWIDRVAQGEWRAFARRLADEPDPQRRDFDIKVVASALAGSLAVLLNAWVEDEPESSSARLVRGAHGIDFAWAIRSGARAKHVQEDQWADFFDLLSAANDDLLEAAQMAPDDAGPWAFLTSCALGLEASRHDAEQILANVQERSPWHPLAYRTMTQYHAAKWHGSNEQLLAFARDVTGKAPVGLPVHAVVPEAHLEAAAESGGRKALQTARDEIVDAADRSIDASDPIESPWWIRTRTAFAVAYHQLGDHDRLRRELEIIGPSVGPTWRMFYSDPVAEFKRARRSVSLP